MTDRNNLLGLMRMAQSTGGSPYDEEQYMPVPGNADQSVLNALLNRRMEQRGLPPGYERLMSERFPHMMTPPGYEQRLRNGGKGTDMQMMEMYGPEDQVVFDIQGLPIPMSDPRHPRNQYSPPSPPPMYPQQRR